MKATVQSSDKIDLRHDHGKMNKRAKRAAETVEQHKARLSRQRERIIDDRQNGSMLSLQERDTSSHLLKLIMPRYKTLL